MAKQHYKVPTSLDMSYLDTEVALQDDSGSGLKPMPIKVIFIWILSVLVLLFLEFQTYLSKAGPLWMILFGLFWLSATWFYGKADESGRVGASLVPVLINYLPKLSRRISTRSTDNAYSYLRICGIDTKGIDDRGVIYWADGTLGLGFRVVGSASILLFDDDRTNILNRVAKFYTKLDMDCELIFDTTKESQKVYKQLEYTQKQFANREVKMCQGFNKLFKERHYVLDSYVGQRFQSVHQYMFIKTPNFETLERFMGMFTDEASSSSRMFRNVQSMDSDDIWEYLKKLTGKES